MIDFTTMPKVELHLHLEGAIPPDTMWELVRRHGGDPDVPTPEALAERFRYRNFPHFISTWEWKLRFHTTPDDYTYLAEAVADDLRSQGHLRVEAYVSPTDSGLDTVEVLTGLDVVRGIEVAIIADLVRDTGPHRAMETLDAVISCADDVGAIGITIGGSEQHHPARGFVDLYERARTAGLRLTAHAGEAAGPESVRSAIDDLGVERIGHGVRAVEDPDLVRLLVDTQIPLETCPTSNLRTGVVAGWESHPVLHLIDAGAFVTVNTDDPALFGCDLAGEYRSLADAGVDVETIRVLTENAIDASWAPPARKRDLHRGLAEWWMSVPEAPVASRG